MVLNRKLLCALARKFFSLICAVKYFLVSIKVGARAPASAPGFSGVALRLALRVRFRSCAPTSAPASRSAAPERRSEERGAPILWIFGLERKTKRIIFHGVVITEKCKASKNFKSSPFHLRISGCLRLSKFSIYKSSLNTY